MEIKGFLIDLDGVLTRDENFTPIEGAVEFIKWLIENKIPFLIATSNSRFPPEEIAEKLQKNGFPINKSRIISPLSVAPVVIKKENIKSLFIIGSERVINFFKEKGFEIKENPDVDAVLVGLDKNLNFQKLKIATTALKVYRSKLFALNRNIISRDDDGLLFPGVGTVAKMLSIACQCNEDFKHFGKMGEEYNRLIFEKLNLPAEKIAMISDDIFIDLAGYGSRGMKTVFVTTGKYTIDDIPEDIKIDIVVNSLTELIGRLTTVAINRKKL